MGHRVAPGRRGRAYKASGGSGASTHQAGQPSGGRVISNDPMVIGQNLEALAKGEDKVIGTGA